jgi:hypothetical protein
VALQDDDDGDDADIEDTRELVDNDDVEAWILWEYSENLGFLVLLVAKNQAFSLVSS